jgi:hypothetical protein
LRSIHETRPHATAEYQADRDGRFAWILCTWHPETSIELEEIRTEIKLEILNSGLRDVSKLDVGKWFKNFFADLHWKLHARLLKTNLKEKGVSVFLGLLFENELHFVQFGRVFCAITQKNKLVPVGQNWHNFHVKGHAELNLLGFSDDDIKVRPQNVLIPEKESLIVLPGSVANPLFAQNPDAGSVLALLESFTGNPSAMWLMFTNQPPMTKAKRKRINKLHISTFILILLTIVAITYVIFGNRFIDVGVRKLRALFHSGQKTSLEQVPEVLNVSGNKIVRYLGRAVSMPAKDVGLEIAWSTDLPYEITVPPTFNFGSLFLASNEILMAFNKKDQHLQWKNSLPARIACVKVTSEGLIVNLADHRIMGISFNGKKMWEQNIDSCGTEGQMLPAVEITNENDPRMDGSITVVPSAKAISVISSASGEIMAKIPLTEDLKFFTDYDANASCFYAVIQNSLACVRMKVSN